MQEQRILILGKDQTLLALRKRIFKMRGFAVATSSDPAAAFADITLGKFALVLFTDIPELRRNALAAIIKGQRPEVLIVMLYAHPGEQDGLADAFLSSLETPAVLLETVATLLQNGRDSS
jgi:DNA-binding response OmpR family regulator